MGRSLPDLGPIRLIVHLALSKVSPEFMVASSQTSAHVTLGKRRRSPDSGSESVSSSGWESMPAYTPARQGIGKSAVAS